MDWRQCVATCADWGASTLVLTGVTLYRIIMFTVYLSASIGPSVLISRVYEYCTGLAPVPNVVESAICMLFVSCWAEFSIGTERRLCGNVLEKYKGKYPNTMTFGRFFVHFLLFILSYTQLYVQFQASHSIPDSKSHKPSSNNRSRHRILLERLEPSSNETEGGENEGKSNQEMHTALFLLALAYLVFITSKNLHKDVLAIVRSLPHPAFPAFNSCMIRIGFAVLHLVANAFYFLPCFAMAYSIRTYKYSGNMTYFQLTFTAALLGMVAALFEMNKPWPQHYGRMPYLYLENNMVGKHILAHVLVIFILVAYYRPFENKKLLEKNFDSSSGDVMIFCLSVAFTVLHIVKYVTHAMLTMMGDLNFTPLPEALELPEPIVSGLGVEEEGSGDTGGGGDSPGACTRDQPGEGAEASNNNNNNEIEQSESSCPESEQGGVPLQQASNNIAPRPLLITKQDLLKALRNIEKIIQAGPPNAKGQGNQDDKKVEDVVGGAVCGERETETTPAKVDILDGNNSPLQEGVEPSHSKIVGANNDDEPMKPIELQTPLLGETTAEFVEPGGLAGIPS